MGVLSCGTTMLDQGVFKNIGSVTWDTTAKTTGFTAVSGNGYFVNTTSGAITVTLPATPSAGDIVGIKDYANTSDTNNITIGRNGSNIQGVADDFIINTEGRSLILVYVDATKGWLVTGSAKTADIADFVTATGGTITTCGDYKIHTFTGPGTFTVTCAGSSYGSSTVDYLVVAGGGGGGGNRAGGGGAGGYRASGFGPAPLQGTALPVSVTGYPITVGGGGTYGTCWTNNRGSSGNNSVFSTITSAGGGGGAGVSLPAFTGGSGGGQNHSVGCAGAAGNTPPVSPPQGNSGSARTSPLNGGAGGGATGPGTGNNPGGPGAPNSISGAVVTYSTGGARGTDLNIPAGSPAPANSGNGGAGGNNGDPGPAPTEYYYGKNGGSGIVIIRYKYQ